MSDALKALKQIAQHAAYNNCHDDDFYEWYKTIRSALTPAQAETGVESALFKNFNCEHGMSLKIIKADKDEIICENQYGGFHEYILKKTEVDNHCNTTTPKAPTEYDKLYKFAQEMAEALEAFAIIAEKIEEQVKDDSWLETPLFYAGDNDDPQKWTITGRGFNRAKQALQKFNAMKETR